MKCFKKIEVNNGRHLELYDVEDGIEIVTYDSKGLVENYQIITPGEFVMLLNYYRNCKKGIEKSDYIQPDLSPIEKLTKRIKQHHQYPAYTTLTMMGMNGLDLTPLTSLCDDLEYYGRARHEKEFDETDLTETTRMLAEQCDKMAFIIVNTMKTYGVCEDPDARDYALRSEEEKELSVSKWIALLENKKERLRPVISWLESSGMNISDIDRHRGEGL